MVAVPVAGCGCAPNTEEPVPNEKPVLAGWPAAGAPNVAVLAAPNSGAWVRAAPNTVDAEEAGAPNPVSGNTIRQAGVEGR